MKELVMLLRNRETINLALKLICKIYNFTIVAEWDTDYFTAVYFNVTFKSTNEIQKSTRSMSRFKKELCNYMKTDKDLISKFEAHKWNDQWKITLSWRIPNIGKTKQ